MSSTGLGGIGMTSQRTRNRLVERLRQKGIQDERVLDAIGAVPRHMFVDEAMATRAYEDSALPIGHGQTISQPYIVARMTEVLLGGGTLDKVLEVGTGSGYQAAVLAMLVQQVYTVERIQPLYRRARDLFYSLRIRNIRATHSDGTWGWEQHAPYDGILVTAAPDEVPESLLLQLAVGGRLVAPVGRSDGKQELQLITRTPDHFEREVLETVNFVPFLSGKST
ncbi:MAG: protein-L-isoaspartate(D-aspartate) O-methyltransferase [Gammaproteobacteria bacterium]|jgi:protein-L-isoaspartate(D-aspartate) O-methyltransferase